MKYALVNQDIFSFTRKFDGDDTFLVVLHFGKNKAEIDLGFAGASAEVVLASGKADAVSQEGSVVDLDNSVIMKAGDGIVFKMKTPAKV